MRDHVAGGHATTRVHMGARVGRHVAGRAGRWRAHGYSGPWLERGGGNVNYILFALPLFNRSFSQYFLRVGLCPTHVLPFAGDVDARRALDSVRTVEIAWTRVHVIIKSTRASKSSLSDGDRGLTCCHVELFGALDPPRTDNDRSEA